MNFSSKLLFGALLSFCFSSAVCGTIDDEFFRNKMIPNLKESSRWIIEEGIHVFKRNGKQGIHRTLVDKWGVQLWVDPWVETEEYLAQFRIKARGIYYDIHNLHRTKVDNTHYEFWVSKIAAKNWSGEQDRSVFYITRADDIFGSREIVHKSDQFIKKYTTPNGTTINLPLNDLNLLYILQAWKFPQNYVESELKYKIVRMDKNGNLYFQ